ncbi:probable E3 ubiquitin-protein ligase RHB1A isoform X5 [Vitis vinifera]|uniref:RING-type E3 ubiquitin transferase n=1 Tax=Vitis vinifera TaxID=29760 RepID=A0A438JLZ6_VITVI|nr:probable E3 ubiquitin-protein ligase RHB1A isoform X5 [Vitis vinifera]RVX09957.1 putative E3 ubiquitin-protein ligase RHB1A [Vitis vinifera]|eukprot:XP_010661848.1 PREDICTED: probable E3 ubiquitin-protein ligase RHB1A isoform X4 [Vitis vinifera]
MPCDATVSGTLPRVCPPTLQEHEFLTSHNGAASAFAAELLVDLNLQTSIPDTYRPPPAPIPYDVVLGHPRSTDCDPVGETINGSKGLRVSDCKTQASSLPTSPRKFELPISNEPNFLPLEEDDACPICLEEYDLENPKTITKCNHHFHLSCILEWMERSETCPVCDQEMILEDTMIM